MNSDNQFLQTIFDNLHTAIMVIGEQLMIEHMNPSAEMLFHFSRNRAVKHSISHLIINEHELFDRLESSLASSHPFRVYEAQLHIHNNTIIDVDYSVSPLENRNHGQLLLLEFSQRNHLHKHSQEEALLNQHEASKSLIRGLAHEIKNPLGGLRGAAQLLERELNEKNRIFTQIIITEADRLKNLVDRMVGPREVPKKTQVNIHKVIEHVRQLVNVEIEETDSKHSKSISILSDYDPSIPDIKADETMLIQSILNITQNAVAAIAHSGEIIFKTRSRRNCSIGTKTYPLVASIEITDNGSGVDTSLQEKIFLPMITGRAEGTGLGLSIAQSLIQQHHGLIEFDSRPGKTTFTLLLPIQHHNGEKYD